MRRRAALPLLALLLGLSVAQPAAAKPEVGPPREIAVDVGENGGLRLMSNAARRWHWTWLRAPDRRIARPDPPQMLPENDEAVNGLSGRTSVTVTGVRQGTTTGLVGYWNAGETKLLKTVRITIVVR